jgi:hypothetical protein
MVMQVRIHNMLRMIVVGVIEDFAASITLPGIEDISRFGRTIAKNLATLYSRNHGGGLFRGRNIPPPRPARCDLYQNCKRRAQVQDYR